MSTEYEKQLEAAVQRELNALGELEAPPDIAQRVMRAIERRAAAPWHRREWQTWPAALQMASLVALLALFGGLCLGGWQLSQIETVSFALRRAGEWFSGLNVIVNTFNVLVSAAALVVKKLGTGFIVTCLIAAGIGYAMCIGLGTVYFRFAFAKR
jgi:ABC-type amino acid transport system permease subunit